MKFRSENGDPRAWQAYTPLLGEELNRVAIRFAASTGQTRTAYRKWSMSNEKVSEHFEEHVAPHSEHWAHYFESCSWRNSHWADKAGSPRCLQ